MQSPEGLAEEERAVLALLRKGATNIEIADSLSIKRSQASSLTDHLMRKLGARTRDDLLDPSRRPAPASAHQARPIESRLIQEAAREASCESQIDWKTAYNKSRKRVFLASPWSIITVVLVVAAAVLTRLNLYVSVALAIAAAGTAALVIRDMRGSRLIIEAKVCGKSVDTSFWYNEYGGGGEENLFQVLIQREATLNAKGEIRPSSTIVERLRTFSVSSSIYNRYDTDDIVVLLCLPSGQVLNDL